jgi:acetyl-CoA carboxylase biotin carboxyl carrier protein
VDYKKILELIKEMNQTHLTRVEIEEEGLRICLEKGVGAQSDQVQANVPQINVNAAPPTAVIQSLSLGEKEENENSDEGCRGEKILSPMVGTYYANPSPDQPPFVKAGDKVKKGQTLCIIEAMKLMNEIESEYEGEVVKVFAKNEEMVEFGQPLFVIA